MLKLGYKKAHKFVENQRTLYNNNVRWDGWDMVFFRPDPGARYSTKNGRPNGVWNREAGSYGFETRVSPNDQGLWEIDWRNVEPNKHTRS